MRCSKYYEVMDKTDFYHGEIGKLIKETAETVVLRIGNVHGVFLKDQVEMSGEIRMDNELSQQEKQARYIDYLKQQASSVLLNAADRANYRRKLKDALKDWESGRGYYLKEEKEIWCDYCLEERGLGQVALRGSTGKYICDDCKGCFGAFLGS